jgi:hypothetical protein
MVLPAMNEHPPTQSPELNRVLDELVGQVRALLGENFVGAYLQGSFALGDGDENSDVDFVVVTREDIADADAARLNAMHRVLHGRPETWAQHLEGSYIPAAELRRLPAEHRDVPVSPRPGDWADPATGRPPRAYPFLFLGNGERSLVRSEHDNTLVVRWILRERGIALAGPNPAELVDPVDLDELRAECREVMRWFGDELLSGKVVIEALWLQGFTVLIYCRMLQSLATGTIVSKPGSVAWAKTNLPPEWAPLIERAWGQRGRYPRGKGAPEAHKALAPEPNDVSQTLAFVRYALERAGG